MRCHDVALPICIFAAENKKTYIMNDIENECDTNVLRRRLQAIEEEIVHIAKPTVVLT